MFRFKTAHKTGLMALVLVAANVAAPPASAQNFFESLFGGGYRRPAPLPPQASSYAPDNFSFGERRSAPSGDVGGPAVSYCVRTCDGRFFPLQRQANLTPVEACKSFCPASKTMVFHGSKIDTATAQNGTRYADLDNAFVYREKVVDNCTCNGKDAFGLVQMSVMTDPTLKPGDIVATNDGLATVKNAKSAEFTPINPNGGATSRMLSAIKVTPQPEPKKVERVADDPPKPARKKSHAARSAQFFR